MATYKESLEATLAEIGRDVAAAALSPGLPEVDYLVDYNTGLGNPSEGTGTPPTGGGVTYDVDFVADYLTAFNNA